MKDLAGKLAAILLLGSAAFNIYIGANVPVLQSVMQSLNAKGTTNIASTFPLIALFVAAGLYGVVGILLLFVKSIRSMNITMGVLVLIMAGVLSYVAAVTFNNSATSKSNIDKTAPTIGTYFGSDTGDKFKTSMTAIGVLPSYAAITGAIAGGISALLLFNRTISG